MSAAKKLNFVKDGGSKLPPGFRFEPTDEEIVFQYLARKIFSHPLPASVIPEINISKFAPWELPGDEDQDRYLFSNKQTGHSTSSRVTCGGYWKATGPEKQIISSEWRPVLGIKKTFVFYKGTNSRVNTRTDWFMHEYRVARLENTGSNFQPRISQDSLTQVGNWVLCHIFFKKGIHGNGRPGIRNFATAESSSENTDSDSDSDSDSSYSSSSSLYSGSSVLTEISSNVSNDHQNASCTSR